MSSAGRLDIAIVGMACHLPDAPDLSTYWRHLLEGQSVTAIESLPDPDLASVALDDAGLSPDPDITPSDRLACAAAMLSTRERDMAIVAQNSHAIVLMRRDDAERSGHRIYAVIVAVSDVAPDGNLDALIRAAMALHHRIRPDGLHAARPWIHGDTTRPRSIDVPGFAMLEEHAGSSDHDGAPLLHRETEAILIAARDRDGLADRIRTIVEWLDDHPEAPLEDIAHTLDGDDPPDDAQRLGVVAESTEDLAGRLRIALTRLDDPSCRAIGDGRGLYHWESPVGGPGRLAFLFPGEGSQYPGMLADLCLHFPEVRRQFDVADRIAIELNEPILPSEEVFGASTGAGLWSTSTAVNVVLNAQWAIYHVLINLGLRPDAVAGHSSGEILALAAAGVFEADRDLERQLGRLGVFFRGLESAQERPTARLVAVAADRSRAEAACRALGTDRVAVAIDNCPHQVVLAGPPAEVDRVADRLRSENVLVEPLPFDRAYHTPEFAAVMRPMVDSFTALSFRSPRLPIYSCATGAPMPTDPESIRDLAIAQWTRTVAFRQTIEAMHADGLRVFVDVGARGNLAGFVQDTLRGRPAFAIAANLPRRSGLTQLNHLVAALFAQGIPIRPGFLHARRRPRRIEALREQTAAVAVGVASQTSSTSIETSIHPLERDESPTFPMPARFHLDDDEPETPVTNDVDTAMLAFQETMRAFLETQQAVLSAYLGTSPAPSTAAPGPWVGDVNRLVPGSEIASVYTLDARTDPIAEHHTIGGRRASALDPTHKGLPVLPFAVMAEMVAQAAALVTTPGLVLTRLEQLHAHKWVRYDDEPTTIELHGHGEPSEDPGEQRVRMTLHHRGDGGRAESARLVFEAVAVFAAQLPEPTIAKPWVLEGARPSRFAAEMIYAEQWLFHGPAMQAVSHVGQLSASGIDGRLRVMPLAEIVRSGQESDFHTDVIVIDSFTHILGCWGLDHLTDHGDVVFPLRMDALRLLGPRPEVGTEVDCRIRIREVQHHRVRVDVEIVRPDGNVWMELQNWEDWRFHWPGRYRDVFRQPQEFLIGEGLPVAESGVKAVWLAPPADMGRPVWRDVLEQTQLGPSERVEHLSQCRSEDDRARRLWRRIAAKDAARRLWRDAGRAPTYPADLAIVDDGQGHPFLIRRDDPADRSLPSIAIADTDSLAVAIATIDPRQRPGVAVGPIRAAEHSERERAMLDRWTGPARAEWASRFERARDAAIQATGAGNAEIIGIDADTGNVHVRTGTGDRQTILVATARRGEYTWAWTLGEGVTR